MTVETSRAQQRAVQHFFAVRCRDHQNTRNIRVINTIHFRQKLIQGLIVLPLLAAFSFSPDYIDLIYENNYILFLLLCSACTGFLEQFPDASCTYTHIHLNEFRA
ncbi:hypothetical protein D3C85_1476480 [compost metagenome]